MSAMHVLKFIFTNLPMGVMCASRVICKMVDINNKPCIVCQYSLTHSTIGVNQRFIQKAISDLLQRVNLNQKPKSNQCSAMKCIRYVLSPKRESGRARNRSASFLLMKSESALQLNADSYMSKWSFIGNAEAATRRQITYGGLLTAAAAADAFHACIEPFDKEIAFSLTMRKLITFWWCSALVNDYRLINIDRLV